MTIIVRWTLAGFALFALLVAVLLALLVFVGLPELASAIEIDGRRIDLLQLRNEHWALIGLGVAAAALVIAVAVPLVAALAVVVPLAGVALATLAALAALGIVLAPIGLLLWWLWKPPRRKATMASP